MFGFLKKIFSQALPPTRPPRFEVGRNVFVMTLTNHYYGEVEYADEDWLVLRRGVHVVFNTGKIEDFLATGNPKYAELVTKEVERISIRQSNTVTVWHLTDDFVLEYEPEEVEQTWE